MPRSSSRVFFRGEWFDSELEAQWAFVFWKLDIDYEHTRKTFWLNGKRYTPDFFLPGLKCYIEIKSRPPTSEEEEKALLLALETQCFVFLFAGLMLVPSMDKNPTPARAYCPECKHLEPEPYYLAECPICRRIAITEEGSVWTCPCGIWYRGLEESLICYQEIKDFPEEGDFVDEYGRTAHRLHWIEHVQQTIRYSLLRSVHTKRLNETYLAARQFQFEKRPFVKERR